MGEYTPRRLKGVICQFKFDASNNYHNFQYGNGCREGIAERKLTTQLKFIIDDFYVENEEKKIPR